MKLFVSGYPSDDVLKRLEVSGWYEGYHTRYGMEARGTVYIIAVQERGDMLSYKAYEKGALAWCISKQWIYPSWQ